MTEEEWERGHPEIDADAFHAALLYALQNLFIAEQKERLGAPCSAEEHRAMAYRKVRDVIEAAGLAVVNRDELIALIALRDAKADGAGGGWVNNAPCGADESV